MGFSVYGRMGRNVDPSDTNYGRDSHYPKVIVSKSRLGSRYFTPRVYPQQVASVNQPYNPKKTAFHKKENEGLKTTLLVLGSALLAYKCAPRIKSWSSKLGGAYSKHCPNMAQAGKSLAAACKAPVNGCKKIGSLIAKPFIAIGKLFAKKPAP